MTTATASVICDNCDMYAYVGHECNPPSPPRDWIGTRQDCEVVRDKTLPACTPFPLGDALMDEIWCGDGRARRQDDEWKTRADCVDFDACDRHHAQHLEGKIDKDSGKHPVAHQLLRLRCVLERFLIKQAAESGE